MGSLTVGEITSIVSVVLVGIGVLVTYLTWRSNTTKQSKKDGEREGTVNAFMETTEKQLSDLDKRVFRLDERFFYFSNAISAKLGIPLYYETKSPIVLTKAGKELAKEIEAQEWVDKVSGILKEKVTGLDAYGIEVFCFEYVDDEDQDQYSDEEEKVIRASAYKRGIRAFDVRRVLAIELRDRLLKEAGLEDP